MLEHKRQGQRLLSKEVDERVIFKVDKSIKKDGVNGVYTFGEFNDCPTLIEKLINGSDTAKPVANIYAKFLTGKGFENTAINNIGIGKDPRGKKITVLSLLRQAATSVSFHNGYYIHCNIVDKDIVNSNPQITEVHIKPFKNCRFNIPDETDYSAKILVYDNWTKDKPDKKYNKADIQSFHVFNMDKTVLKAEMSTDFKGQIFFQFFDDQYFYPLSNFDPVYLQMDTEAQSALYQNRQIRDGFFKKIVMRTAPGGTDQEKEDYIIELKKQLGPNGSNVVLIEEDIDDNGELSSNSAYKFDQVESNVEPDLFNNWEKSIANKIRKSGGKGVPAILIDYEEGKLSTTSGESIIQATAYYNAITFDDRKMLGESLGEVLSKMDIPELANNTNWNIIPLQLIEIQQNGTTDNQSTAGN